MKYREMLDLVYDVVIAFNQDFSGHTMTRLSMENHLTHTQIHMMQLAVLLFNEYSRPPISARYEVGYLVYYRGELSFQPAQLTGRNLLGPDEYLTKDTAIPRQPIVLDSVLVDPEIKLTAESKFIAALRALCSYCTYDQQEFEEEWNTNKHLFVDGSNRPEGFWRIGFTNNPMPDREKSDA